MVSRKLLMLQWKTLEKIFRSYSKAVLRRDTGDVFREAVHSALKLGGLLIGVLSLGKSDIAVTDDAGDRNIIGTCIVHKGDNRVPCPVRQERYGDAVGPGEVLNSLFQAFDRLMSHWVFTLVFF